MEMWEQYLIICMFSCMWHNVALCISVLTLETCFLNPPSWLESSSSEFQYTCTWTTQHHIPEDRDLYIYCRDSIKSYTIINEVLYPLFVTISKQWITTRLHPVMGFYIIVSLFYLTIVICHFTPQFHPPFMWAVSWVNYINMLNELIGRGHWWCCAFIFFYERTVIYIVCFLLGNSPASEFYMPTFRNTLSVPSS
jgi:hypothetical protein